MFIVAIVQQTKNTIHGGNKSMILLFLIILLFVILHISLLPVFLVVGGIIAIVKLVGSDK